MPIKVHLVHIYMNICWFIYHL